MVVGLWSSEWREQAAAAVAAERLLEHAPRVAVGPGVVWADARGLDARALAERLRASAADVCADPGGPHVDVHVGAAVCAVPAVAAVGARIAAASNTILIIDDARAFLADRPVRELIDDASVLGMLEAVGIQTCGELAQLDREAVEVRFGPALLDTWRYARGEDPRRLFLPIPPEPLHSSVDFVDYVVTDPERLIFSANALLAGLCDRLRAGGQHARRATLTLSLANGQSWSRTLRPARPTANRVAWLRLVRGVLERITVPDAVCGIAIALSGMEAAAAVQGDLFDRGFASAAAVEAALARLIEAQGERVIVEPEVTQHPMAERRTEWTTGDDNAMREAASDTKSGLTLQLLDAPRVVQVETMRRRDHDVPIRYRIATSLRDGGVPVAAHRHGDWQQIVTAAGPDRISGGRWDQGAYAREYFRAVTEAGVLIWLYRDARCDEWYLQGWWD